MNNWHQVEGWLDPPGVSWVPHQNAWNFVLYARHATRVELLLFSADDFDTPLFIFEFDHYRNKSGPVWHCRISQEQAEKAVYYAYRVDGPPANEQMFHRFDFDKLLLDPYAKAVYFPPNFDREAAKGSGSNLGKAPLGVIEQEDKFNWDDDKFLRHDADLIIYEMHVKGFTRNPNSGVSSIKQGTFAGIVEKIPYLRDLGVTAVELMPVFQYDPAEGNYWGYMPLNFFAPHHEYSMGRDSREVRNEFRNMVRELHRAGIEVILDVVYNHTCEGDDQGPNYCFRGIANNQFYMPTMGEDGQLEYANYSGCGNTLDANQQAVKKLIVDSLRYWRDEMHVDGFRFDLASIFARNRDGSVSAEQPPIFSQIVTAEDFLNVRLIAEPWDAAGSYQLGHSFPGWLWMQWNGRYRDALQRFVSGEPGMVSELMTRIYGSADLFPDDIQHSCRPWQSINYISSHDGSTLYDLVAYHEKNNWANGEENRDGSHEFKWNCGHEGEIGVPSEVELLRKQQVKNYLTILMLSNGSPMLRMGDEFMQTQGGNNNAYNQDNETSWLDWDRLKKNQDIFRFTKAIIELRKHFSSISRSYFWRHEVSWYGPHGPCDMGSNSHTLAFSLLGSTQHEPDLYVMINGSDSAIPFEIAEGPAIKWKRIVDTSKPAPYDISSVMGSELVTKPTYTVQERSVVVLFRDT